MKADKTRRILAIVALVFMAIFTVTFIIVLVSPDILNGAVGYIALISALMGAGFFIVVKFVLKDPPEYLPGDESGDEADDTDASEKDGGDSDSGRNETPGDNDGVS